MGNCLFGGMGGGEAAQTIQVVTANGGIMEFHGPITVGFILEEFPCHAIFKSDDLFWKPLLNSEELHPGVSYLLLPLHTSKDAFDVKVGHVRSKSIPNCTTGGGNAAAYRMSFDSRSTTTQSNVLKRSNTDVFSRYNKGAAKEGVWKVKLVISPGQLLEILSQEARTEELIESVRTVAKCGCGGAASTGFSDQWSVASSRASSKKD
ncbi:hypothetical protein BVRB_5g104200 [Beta vulgaris subsp. vulgaris]|uniref:uncharacterized protein LOC104892640 n=1 Tax=Beta vulgaris subsp. vulgaris TaxID=3555 RepID=UPI00053F82D3|nr:uncharacterized protein LOC104892640 [Beta vulgaris subsp. vulgaris]KMT12493.1 hypothetical protein BVRB_5g104200 [Beta vulgaris subsp. vulgaris]